MVLNLLTFSLYSSNLLCDLVRNEEEQQNDPLKSRVDNKTILLSVFKKNGYIIYFVKYTSEIYPKYEKLHNKKNI